MTEDKSKLFKALGMAVMGWETRNREENEIEREIDTLKEKIRGTKVSPDPTEEEKWYTKLGELTSQKSAIVNDRLEYASKRTALLEQIHNGP